MQTKPCWVNVYKGLYADCSDGAPYYISLGYNTKNLALLALDTPKAKGIRDRFIATVMIELPEDLVKERVYFVCEIVLFGRIHPVFRENEKLKTFKLKREAEEYLGGVIENSDRRYRRRNFVILRGTLTGDLLTFEYTNLIYEMKLGDETYTGKKL